MSRFFLPVLHLPPCSIRLQEGLHPNTTCNSVILSCTDLRPVTSIPPVPLSPSFLPEYHLLTTEIGQTAVSFFFECVNVYHCFLNVPKIPLVPNQILSSPLSSVKKILPKIPKLLPDIVQLCVTFKHCYSILQQGNVWPVSPAMCWSQWRCIQSCRNLILQSWFCSHPELQLLPAIRESLQRETQGWNSPATYWNNSHWLTWLQYWSRLSQQRSHLTGTALLWHSGTLGDAHVWSSCKAAAPQKSPKNP